MRSRPAGRVGVAWCDTLGPRGGRGPAPHRLPEGSALRSQH